MGIAFAHNQPAVWTWPVLTPRLVIMVVVVRDRTTGAQVGHDLPPNAISIGQHARHDFGMRLVRDFDS